MYLRQRNGIWYFRRRVPSDLEGVIPHFNYSLHTRKRQEAVRAYAAALALSEDEIASAREKLRADADKGRIEVAPSRREYQQQKAMQAQRKRARAFCQYGDQPVTIKLLDGSLHLITRGQFHELLILAGDYYLSLWSTLQQKKAAL